MFNTNSVIGLSEESAIKVLSEQGFKVRVRSRNGVPLMGKRDANPNRFNLTIVEDKVVATQMG